MEFPEFPSLYGSELGLATRDLCVRYGRHKGSHSYCAPEVDLGPQALLWVIHRLLTAKRETWWTVETTVGSLHNWVDAQPCPSRLAPPYQPSPQNPGWKKSPPWAPLWGGWEITEMAAFSWMCLPRGRNAKSGFVKIRKSHFCHIVWGGEHREEVCFHSVVVFELDLEILLF